MNSDEPLGGAAVSASIKALQADNLRLRRESDRFRQLLQGSAEVASVMLDLADALQDTRDLARELLAGIRNVNQPTDDLLLAARELSLALEDPQTGQCHACGARLVRNGHQPDCPGARFERLWGVLHGAR